MNEQHKQKMLAAQVAIAYLQNQLAAKPLVIGVGTGSTVGCFIEQLQPFAASIESIVASSEHSKQQLRKYGFAPVSLNQVSNIDCYIDGADEINTHGQMIKGGGGALTGEKLLASMCQQFICMVDQSKVVQNLGQFPVAVEVLQEARSMVARKLVAEFNADPIYRQGFISDNNNVILDVHHLDLTDPSNIEMRLKAMTGVVESGIFSIYRADTTFIATRTGIEQKTYTETHNAD